jgi:hypothetical protein
VIGILLITCGDGQVWFIGEYKLGTYGEGWGTEAVLKTCIESTTEKMKELMMSFVMRDPEAVAKAAQADQEEQDLLETTANRGGPRAPRQESPSLPPTPALSN